MKIKLLILLREMFSYSKNHTAPMNAVCGQKPELLNVKACAHIGVAVL
jgi:hypothetical protein